MDLTQANAKLQALRVEARLVENVNPQVVRITTAAFCGAGQQDSHEHSPFGKVAISEISEYE